MTFKRKKKIEGNVAKVRKVIIKNFKIMEKKEKRIDKV